VFKEFVAQRLEMMAKTGELERIFKRYVPDAPLQSSNQ
jgi:hypothetical protein